MKAKQRVLNELAGLSESDGWASAESIAAALSISRQNVSHYLNQLLTEAKVVRKSGRPVLWQISTAVSAPKMTNQDGDTFGTFMDIIGYDGSLRAAIMKCISSVNYPDGLSILLQGPSGVGKSFLAHKIVEFAREQKAIAPEAPFTVLNCADYADNPELLSATLFGYKKGAFTGANQNQSGLLAAANNGYLFLDEVHRLSSENQEKLFLFMDSGKFRPIGENVHWSTSKVRLIFATTEDANQVFLETFKRRIEVSVRLPSFSERPLIERLALISHFFKAEAEILERNIRVSGMALEELANTVDAGNVGRVRNVVKLVCADVFSQSKDTVLNITGQSVQTELGVESKPISGLNLSTLQVDWRSSARTELETISKPDSFTPMINDAIRGMSLSRLESSTQQAIKVERNVHTLTAVQKMVSESYEHTWNRLIVKKYGMVKATLLGKSISEVAVFNPVAPVNLEEAIRIIDRKYPRSAYLARQFVSTLTGIKAGSGKVLQLVATIGLAEFVQEDIPLKGLLIAHGEHTASSIQSVVNQLCGNYVFEAIDMPMDSGVDQIVGRVRQFISKEVKEDSLVLLVDMGSLNQLYSQLKNDLNGELLIVDNLTTAVALDIGLKIQNRDPFELIAKDAELNYRINIQYFAGFARKSNIIVSCMSGIGISEQLSAIFSKYLSNSQTEIFTRDYRTVRRLIDQNDEDYFQKTKMVITTSALPSSFSIPNINIYDILDSKGSLRLEKLLADDLSPAQFKDLMQELVRFFSLEGVADRLNFLNPKMVISEVETVVSKYENIFKLNLTGTVKLNLYMHVALMMERLFVSQESVGNSNESIMPPKTEEFYRISHSIFQPMEMKYRFKVNDYELSLLYEISGSLIKE